jgi:hypothetical protein
MRYQPNPKTCNQKIPNQHIFLYQGFLELLDGDTVIEGKGNIRLTWYPSPRVSIKFIYSCKDGDLIDSHYKPLQLKLTELSPQARLQINGYRCFSQGGRTELHGYLTEPFIHGRTEDLASVVFHLPNLEDFEFSNQYLFDGEDNEIEQEGWLYYFRHQLIFESHGWNIVLGCLESHYDLNELLREQGGYGLGHICKIQRTDCTSFGLEESYQQIEAFCFYLSLIRGLWIPPIMVSGYDANCDLVCEEWRSPIIRGDAWESSEHLFEYLDSSEIITCFPEFINKWQDDDWQKAIKNVIQWYIESLKESTSSQTSMILLQAALEQLSWTYLNKGGYLTGSEFKKISATAQIRLFFKVIDARVITFPDDSEISKIGKEFNWENTIHAAVEIRNSVVHPPINRSSERLTKISEIVMAEAVTISRQHVKNALIRIFEEKEDKMSQDREEELDSKEDESTDDY